MISLDTSGLVQFEADLETAFEKLEMDMSKRYRDFTRSVFEMIVRNSPQWSANLASNWNYSIGSPDERYSQVYDKGKETSLLDKPFSRQEPSAYAIATTIARMRSQPQPSWRDEVFITNATPADEGGYLAAAMEAGVVKLRPSNLIRGQVALFKYTVAIKEKAVL